MIGKHSIDLTWPGFFKTLALLFIMLATSACAAPVMVKDNVPSGHKPFAVELLDSVHGRIYPSRQVILAESKEPESLVVDIYALEKNEAGWRVVYGPLKGNIGRNGFAEPGGKREGDGKTPSGIFPLGTAFGYGGKIGSRMPYRQATAEDFWVDDVNSPFYNRWVTGNTGAESAEKMRRDDDLYKCGIVIEYNTNPVIRGHGSAIFIHIWRGEGKPTAGCISMSEKDLVGILAWLDPSEKPVVVMGTVDQLERLR